MLTLRRFLDVAAAILVEAYMRLGTDMLTAIDNVNAFGGSVEAEPEKVAEDNAKSMDALMAMMGGVKGAPV